MTDAARQITLTRRQVREVDRRAIEEYGIPGIVLMENAARNATDVIMTVLDRPGTVAIVCGRGNNGGDGFAIARHLANRGVAVELYTACEPAELAGDAATNWHIVRKMGLPCRVFHTSEAIQQAEPALAEAVVIVDAVLGTGFTGQVRAPLDQVIRAINQAGRRQPRADKMPIAASDPETAVMDRPLIVAIDVPSGLDCDTGQPSNATVQADVTVTFVARKTGFDGPGATDYTGRVHVCDIGAPPDVNHDVASVSEAG